MMFMMKQAEVFVAVDLVLPRTSLSGSRKNPTVRGEHCLVVTSRGKIPRERPLPSAKLLKKRRLRPCSRGTPQKMGTSLLLLFFREGFLAEKRLVYS